MIESVSLAEVIAAARGRHASLVPETSGYILLGVVRAMGGRPMKVDPREIRLDTDGLVVIDGRRERRAPSVTAAGLRELLRRLLAVGQGNPTTLAAVADPPDGADVPLDKLFTGVTRALIPINRSAAKRALARLARETLRAKARRQLDAAAMHDARTGWDAAAEATEALNAVADAPGPGEAVHDDAAVADEVGVPVPSAAATSQPSDPCLQAPGGEAAAVRTPSPTPSIAVDVAENDEWDDIDADIDLLTPTPRPTVEPTPTLMDPAIDEKHEIAAVEAAADDPTDASVETSAEDDLEIEVDVAPMVALTPAPTTIAHDDEDLSWPLHAPVAAKESDGTDEGTSDEGTSDEAASHTPAAGGAQLNPAPADEPAVVEPAALAEPKTETELAEVLYQAAAALQPRGIRTDKPTFAKAPGEQGSVEDLLNQLDASDRDEDPVLAAAASLQSMMGLDLSPFPAPVMAMAADDLRDEEPFRRPSLIELPTTPEPRDDLEALESLSVSIPLDDEDLEDDASAPIALAERQEADGEELDDGDDLEDGIDDEELDDEDDLEDENDEDELDEFEDDDELEDEESVDDDRDPAHDHDALIAHEVPTPDADDVPSSVDGDGAAQSISPPPTAVTDRFTATPPPRRRWTAALGAVALLATVGVAAQALLPNGPLELLAEQLAAPAGADASTGQCVAELRLHDLPESHEILLGLGEAPLTTRPVPTGVRLELVATAPAFEPERVVVPVDANWVEVEEGHRQLAVSMTLERGVSDHWPPAPAGKVGGIGPAGRIHVATEPTAEIWMVAAAGRGADATVVVACGADANLLVVDRSQPQQQRRLSVASAMLDAAARSGGADLSGRL